MRTFLLVVTALLSIASALGQSSTTPATHGVDSVVLHQNVQTVDDQIGTRQSIDDISASPVWSAAADALLAALNKAPAFTSADRKKLTDLERG